MTRSTEQETTAFGFANDVFHRRMRVAVMAFSAAAFVFVALTMAGVL